MTRNKNITEKDLFYFYPYKTNPITTGNTIPQPYVKKTEVSDHAFTLTYDMWSSIIKDYILEVRDLIFRGKVFKIPRYLGTFQLMKYTCYRNINWGETTKQGEKVYYTGDDNVKIIVKWYRTYKNSQFVFKNHWKIRMCKGFRISLSEHIKENPNYIYNLIDT